MPNNPYTTLFDTVDTMQTKNWTREAAWASCMVTECQHVPASIQAWLSLVHKQVCLFTANEQPTKGSLCAWLQNSAYSEWERVLMHAQLHAGCGQWCHMCPWLRLFACWQET